MILKMNKSVRHSTHPFLWSIRHWIDEMKYMYKLYAVCLVQFFHSLFDQQAFCEIRKLWVMENYPAVNIFCELWPFGTYDPDKRPLLASRTRCNVPWKPPKIGNKVKIGIKVQLGNKFANRCNVCTIEFLDGIYCFVLLELNYDDCWFLIDQKKVHVYHVQSLRVLSCDITYGIRDS